MWISRHLRKHSTYKKYCFILFIQIYCHGIQVWLVKNSLSPNFTAYMARRELTFPMLYVNILRPKQTGHHFADDIFKCIFVNENLPIMIQISLQVVLNAMLTVCHHWFRKWLGIAQATSHYPTQWWPSSLTHIYKSQCVKENVTWD